MSGADIAAEVSEAIRLVTAEVGNGTPLAGEIIRTTPGDETVYPPAAPTEATFTCNLMLSEYSARDRVGTDITVTDLRAVITADSQTDPRNGDVLKVAGIEYGLTNVSPYQPGGTVLYWTATARRG